MMILMEQPDRPTAPEQGDHQMTTYTVTIKKQFPAWDENEGLGYYGVEAESKSAAIKIIRNQARWDGNTGPGQGRQTFSAVAE
jgi:hypothetical protein|tara:strand:+ start:50 stop:298 length:249 start_codon:yes stop_codon:yes gene_type:complete